MRSHEPRDLRRSHALKDVDSTARAQLIRAFAWLLPALTVLGASAVFAGGAVFGLSALQSWIVGILVVLGGAAFFYVVVYSGVIGRTASFLGNIYGGSSTPAQRLPSYSQAQALASQGAYSEALALLEAEVIEDPGNPGPYLAAAAICLEGSKDHQLAVSWYRRARTAERISAETSAYVCIRLADIYEASGEIGPASVELRRLIEVYLSRSMQNLPGDGSDS